MVYSFPGAGLFSTWGLTSGEMPVDELVSKASASGVSWIAAQFTDENFQHFPNLKQACESRGITFGIWDSDPDSWRVTQIAQYGPTFWIAESEGAATDWHGIITKLPANIQGAVITNFSGLDDSALQQAGWVCMPECYLPENPQATVAAQTYEANRRGYHDVVCCLGVYWGVDLAEYEETDRFSIWNCESMEDSDWDELTRRTPVPPEEPVEDHWWQHAYSGGPMVKVKGFPRPLYPPDANQHGKQPSVDGPDVVAYKRTVSRAGRWPWQAFDDSFSNGFSHGKAGGNVGDSGIAGIQRQQHIDATGWIGTTTFNTLRSIIIPEGLPHAGEMAMDAVAADMINQAWNEFGGHEPAKDSGTLVRNAALTLAIDQIGYSESPAGSNSNKYGSWYNMNGVPWCAIFVTWCFETNFVGESPSFVKGSRYSYVPYIVADARAGRYGLHTTDDPIPGDLVCYDWQWNGEYDHIGIFEKWNTGIGQFSAIEGNTSTSNDSNGGQVMRRSRNTSEQSTVFVRVAEP